MLRSETSEEKAHYLDAMEQEIRSYEAQNKTGNEVLDTILTSKSLYCQQHGITLTCVADGAALDFMDTMDLCSLFGNALDNAIESVEKLPDSEQYGWQIRTVWSVGYKFEVKLKRYFTASSPG